jgi:uncharacterized protein (DUF58 family)
MAGSGRAVSRALRAVPETTLLGRLALTFLGVALFFAVAIQDNPALFAVSVAAATAVASAGVTALACGRLVAERSLPERVVAGESFPVRLRVTNRSRLLPAIGVAFRDALQKAAPGAVTVGPSVPVLAPGASVVIAYETAIHQRGVHDVTHALAATRFPFGLFERRVLLRSPGRVVVVPALGRVRPDAVRDLDGPPRPATGQPRSARRGGEFHSLREYRSGDDPRHIHWRTSARAGTLVRRLLRDEREEDRIVLLDTYAAGIDAERRRHAFERAVSCAATLVVEAARRGRRTVLLLPGRPPVVAEAPGGAAAALDALAEVRRGGTTARELVAAAPIRRGARALLLSLLGPADEACREAAARGVRLAVWDVSHPEFAARFRR